MNNQASYWCLGLLAFVTGFFSGFAGGSAWRSDDDLKADLANYRTAYWQMAEAYEQEVEKARSE